MCRGILSGVDASRLYSYLELGFIRALLFMLLVFGMI